MRKDEVRGGQRLAWPQLLLRMDLVMCSMPAHSPGLHHSIRIQEPRVLELGGSGRRQHSARFLSILRVESGDGLCLQMAQYLAEQFI